MDDSIYINPQPIIPLNNINVTEIMFIISLLYGPIFYRIERPMCWKIRCQDLIISMIG